MDRKIWVPFVIFTDFESFWSCASMVSHYSYDSLSSKGGFLNTYTTADLLILKIPSLKRFHEGDSKKTFRDVSGAQSKFPRGSGASRLSESVKPTLQVNFSKV